jgi:hypothetical protein
VQLMATALPTELCYRCFFDGVLNVEPCGALVLLCHNFWCCIVRWQQGHRGRVCANVMAILTLSVAMELRTWRSGRIGRSTGSVTVG